MQFKARTRSSYFGWSDWGQPSVALPTLPSDMSVVIESRSQSSVTASIFPIMNGSAAPIGIKCWLAHPPAPQYTFGDSHPEYRSTYTSFSGNVSRDVVAGHSILRSPLCSSFTVTNIPAPETESTCQSHVADSQLQRCTEYKLKCQVQNTAGWSPPTESAVFQMLPDIPLKAAQPQINQIRADGVKLANLFTITLVAPVATSGHGGVCSTYTFRVQVNASLSRIAIVDRSDLEAGDFVASELLENTSYSVTVWSHNQAGNACSAVSIEQLIVDHACRLG